MKKITKMKLAVSNLAWDQMHEEEILPVIRSIGISGIEIAPTKIWDNPIAQQSVSVKKYSSDLKQKGFVIPSIQSILFRHQELKIFSDSNTRENTLEYIKKMIKIASWLGAEVIVFGSPKNRRVEGMNKENVLNISKIFFREISLECEKNKIIFCLEPNPKEYGTDFILNIEEAIKLIKLVDSPNFRLNLDTGCLMLNREDINRSIRAASALIAHVQISEPFLGPINSILAHRKISKVLKDIGYNKWFSIEILSKKYNKRILVDSIRRVKDIYEF